MHLETAGSVLLLAALVLDRTFGDPSGWPHPVRGVGWMADRVEHFGRTSQLWKGSFGPVLKVLLGGLCWLAVVVASTVLVAIVCSIPLVSLAAYLYFSYAGLAMGSLLQECRRVSRLLEAGKTDAGRNALAMLVSRDVSLLDGQKLRATLAETLSENLNDGFTAPLFYLCVGGVAGMWGYKAASTLDSMWGYRTERYGLFGRVAARADDVLAFVPARMTAGAILLAALLKRLVRPVEVPGLAAAIRRDARGMDSPNAGWPMAAAAWCLGTPMGGPAVYGGKLKDKPVLGPRNVDGPTQAEATWDDGRVRELLSLVELAGTVLSVMAIGSVFLLSVIL